MAALATISHLYSIGEEVIAFRQKILLSYRSCFLGSPEFPNVNLAERSKHEDQRTGSK
ncbi:hypothetical protein PCANC_16310 [Puccinia coronata f. sp. avenae]|uniref:Uncharacterized protein n=1 Tax=Puccinia coronata f. sp. avenae TaxID=200324 RepID=A0A2N5UHA5_9BASI|nr:hypothetical protein PCANC_16310 [Puccinia coronata f. sp. avenae]